MRRLRDFFCKFVCKIYSFYFSIGFSRIHCTTLQLWGTQILLLLTNMRIALKEVQSTGELYIRHYTSPTFAVLYIFGYVCFLYITSYLKCGLIGILSAHYQYFAFCWPMLKLGLLWFKIGARYITIVLFIHLFPAIHETEITNINLFNFVKQ